MMLSDEEIKALAHKAGDGETGRREFSADLSWLLAFARMVEAAESERCAMRLQVTRAEVSLAAGEMSAQEWRTVAAVLRWMQDRIRGA